MKFVREDLAKYAGFLGGIPYATLADVVSLMGMHYVQPISCVNFANALVNSDKDISQLMGALKALNLNLIADKFQDLNSHVGFSGYPQPPEPLKGYAAARAQGWKGGTRTTTPTTGVSHRERFVGSGSSSSTPSLHPSFSSEPTPSLEARLWEDIAGVFEQALSPSTIRSLAENTETTLTSLSGRQLIASWYAEHRQPFYVFRQLLSVKNHAVANRILSLVRAYESPECDEEWRTSNFFWRALAHHLPLPVNGRDCRNLMLTLGTTPLEDQFFDKDGLAQLLRLRKYMPNDIYEAMDRAGFDIRAKRVADLIMATKLHVMDEPVDPYFWKHQSDLFVVSSWSGTLTKKIETGLNAMIPESCRPNYHHYVSLRLQEWGVHPQTIVACIQAIDPNATELLAAVKTRYLDSLKVRQFWQSVATMLDSVSTQARFDLFEAFGGKWQEKVSGTDLANLIRSTHWPIDKIERTFKIHDLPNEANLISTLSLKAPFKFIGNETPIKTSVPIPPDIVKTRRAVLRESSLEDDDMPSLPSSSSHSGGVTRMPHSDEMPPHVDTDKRYGRGWRDIPSLALSSSSSSHAYNGMQSVHVYHDPSTELPDDCPASSGMRDTCWTRFAPILAKMATGDRKSLCDIFDIATLSTEDALTTCTKLEQNGVSLDEVADALEVLGLEDLSLCARNIFGSLASSAIADDVAIKQEVDTFAPIAQVLNKYRIPEAQQTMLKKQNLCMETLNIFSVDMLADIKLPDSMKRRLVADLKALSL